jgi:hypothetical protein
MKYLMEMLQELDKDQHTTKMDTKINLDQQEIQVLDILAFKIKTVNFLKN